MSMPGPLIVTVSGIDGSGKSEFGRHLIAACTAAGVGAYGLRVDDFRRPVDFSDPARELDSYYDEYFDLGALDAQVAELAGHERAGVIVVEGIFVRRVARLVGAFSVWLEVSRAEARRRIEARDVAKGRTLEDVQHRIDARYFPAQDRYLAACDPVGAADVVIDNGDFRHPRIVRGADRSLWPPPLRGPLAVTLGLET